MSYILDALRRADAERERERTEVPGLHTPRMTGDVPSGSRAGNPLVWVIAGLSLVLVCALVWISVAGPEAPVHVAQSVATPPSPEPAVAAAAPTMVGAAPEAMPLPSVVERTSPPPLARPMERPAPRVNASKAASASTPVPAPEVRVSSMNELPEQIRRELPTLPVGGAMYSDKKSSRMLILNGQLLHEGDQAAPGVTLEQIRLKSAVLEYKGHRYKIDY